MIAGSWQAHVPGTAAFDNTDKSFIATAVSAAVFKSSAELVMNTDAFAIVCCVALTVLPAVGAAVAKRAADLGVAPADAVGSLE